MAASTYEDQISVNSTVPIRKIVRPKSMFRHCMLQVSWSPFLLLSTPQVIPAMGPALKHL